MNFVHEKTYYQFINATSYPQTNNLSDFIRHQIGTTNENDIYPVVVYFEKYVSF